MALAGLQGEARQLAEALVAGGQGHLFASAASPPPQLLSQLSTLHASYPGGLTAYLATARRLLAVSQRGGNPLEGWVPSVPSAGFDLTPGTDPFLAAERAGLEAAGRVGFVVPAGGLGERLGFSGVKLALPAETSSGASVMEVYAGYILALQRYAQGRAGEDGWEGRPEKRRRGEVGEGERKEGEATGEKTRAVRLPLAIMVSDDTERGIRELLEANAYYGMEAEQVTFLRQEKVAALSNADAKIALAAPHQVATKPHGHGDIHFLMHKSGTARKWADAGIEWIMFFQDTNILYFSTFLASIGVSAQNKLAVNIISCPRKAREAIGCVAQLDHSDGRRMVASVEYNQIEPLLLASGWPEGDCNESEGSKYPPGYSRFPGNINELIFNLPAYLEVWCVIQGEYGYFPCKNDIATGAMLSARDVPAQTASTAEMAVYNFHFAAAVPRSFRGVAVQVGPMVSLMPDFAPCLSLLSAKLPQPTRLCISLRSSLVVRGEDVQIDELVLDGALEIFVKPG
ncbi:MAG: hypothetical protein SGPRY_009050, partial [Prymnesium sp.]